MHLISPRSSTRYDLAPLWSGPQIFPVFFFLASAHLAPHGPSVPLLAVRPAHPVAGLIDILWLGSNLTPISRLRPYHPEWASFLPCVHATSSRSTQGLRYFQLGFLKFLLWTISRVPRSKGNNEMGPMPIAAPADRGWPLVLPQYPHPLLPPHGFEANARHTLFICVSMGIF